MRYNRKRYRIGIFLNSNDTYTRMLWKGIRDVAARANIETVAIVIPSLTTVRQPIFELGLASCKILMDMLNGNEYSTSVKLSTEMILRRSCGCNPFVQDQNKFKETRKYYIKRIRGVSNKHLITTLEKQ